MADRQSIGEDVTALIGNTPMVYLSKITAGAKGRVAVKLEYLSPACSVKDRVGVALLKAAEKEKKIIPGVTTLIEATSGNMGIALSFASAAKGYRCILTMPASMSVERRTLFKAYGAQIVLTDAAKGMKGAIAKAAELQANIPNSIILGQFDNPTNPEIHYLTTGPEIWRQTNGKVDAVVFGVGSGGTLTGVARYLKEQNPNIKVFAVEPNEAAFLSGKVPGVHKIQGMGVGFAPKVLDTKIYDEVITVPGDDAIVMSKRLAAEEGILCGISSGANATAALNVASRPEFAGKLVVTVLASFGERYLSSALYADVRDEAMSLTVDTLEESLLKLKTQENESKQ